MCCQQLTVLEMETSYSFDNLFVLHTFGIKIRKALIFTFTSSTKISSLARKRKERKMQGEREKETDRQTEAKREREVCVNSFHLFKYPEAQINLLLTFQILSQLEERMLL